MLPLLAGEGGGEVDYGEVDCRALLAMTKNEKFRGILLALTNPPNQPHNVIPSYRDN